jgi:hypothetical protein
MVKCHNRQLAEISTPGVAGAAFVAPFAQPLQPARLKTGLKTI